MFKALFQLFAAFKDRLDPRSKVDTRSNKRRETRIQSAQEELVNCFCVNKGLEFSGKIIETSTHGCEMTISVKFIQTGDKIHILKPDMTGTVKWKTEKHIGIRFDH